MADESSIPDLQTSDQISDADSVRVEPEGATPPGYDWPTHGGYLGCLLAVMLSCLLAPLGYLVVGFLGALLSPSLGGAGVGIAITVTIIGYVALFVGLTRLGWGMGRRYLREYPQPQGQTWGEEAAPALACAEAEGDPAAE